MSVRPWLALITCAATATLFAPGCGEPDAPGPAGADADADAGDPRGPTDEAPTTCSRVAKPADRDRYVVISHPYGPGSSPVQASNYEVFRLSTTGRLTRLNVTFSANRMVFGEIVFTPDGALGFTVDTNAYTIGVFALHDDGSVDVLDPGYASPSFTPSRLVVSPDGSRLLVIDGNTPANGGGVYALRIGCDGSLSEEGLLTDAHLPADLAFVPAAPERWLLAGRTVAGGPATDDLTLLHGLAPTARLASADLFADDQQLVVDLEVTADGRYALLADASAWSGVPHRLAVAELVDGSVARSQLLSPLVLEYPTALAVSPFGNALLVVTAESCCDGLSLYAYDPTDSVAPFTAVGELTYQGGRPELPSAAQVIQHGGLRGRVLIPENLGIRQVQFLAGGDAVDLGKTGTGTGYAAIVGALGVQP